MAWFRVNFIRVTALVIGALNTCVLVPKLGFTDDCLEAKKAGIEQAKDPNRIFGRLAVAGTPDIIRNGADVLVADQSFRTLNLKLPCLDLPENQSRCCLDAFQKKRFQLQEEIDSLIRKTEAPNNPELLLCMDQYLLGKSVAENQRGAMDPFTQRCSEDGVAPNFDQILHPGCYTMGYESSVKLDEALQILKDHRSLADRTSKPLTPISPSPTGTPEPNASGAK